MSMSPFFFIEMYNHKEGKWNKVTLYTKKKGVFSEVDLWPWNGTHDVFTVLGFEDSYPIPEFNNYVTGLPKNCSDEMNAIYRDHCWEKETYSYKPGVHVFNLADLHLYLRDNPKVEDAEKMEEIWISQDIPWEEVEKVYCENPVATFIQRVESYLNLYDDFWKWDHALSDVRVIGWISR